MARYVHLVFSDPPRGVAASEYDRWYDEHVREILAVDGWVSVTRFRIDAVVGADASGGYRYLACYELDRPPDEAVANLVASGMGDADSYQSRPDHDALPVPPWFADVRFSSWNCTRIDPRSSSA
jgi:hypothetical protein